MSDTCKNERAHYAPYEWDAFLCSECGCMVTDHGGAWTVTLPFNGDRYEICIRYCPNCGRKVEGLDD